MDTPDSTGTPDALDTTEPGARPWTKGVGFLLLGLAVSAAANALGLHGETGLALRAFGTVGYAAGLLVAGAGVHRILWVGPPARGRWLRLVVTALVTLPAFVVTAIVLSVILTVVQRRFSF
jgi:hypothetical protein